MAYISQYEADQDRQARADKGLGMALQGFQGMEENRARALAQKNALAEKEAMAKKAQDDKSIAYASMGATPDLIEAAQNGDLTGLQAFLSSDYQAKKAVSAQDKELDRRFKESQIAENNRGPQAKIDPVELHKQKLQANADFAKKNLVNGKNSVEFNSRMQNIIGESEQLKSLVNKNGTFEALGPHNALLAQKIDAIATDAAKLFDPESVARESEVAAFRKMLFEPGSLTTSNESALKTVDGFKKLVQDRAARSRGEKVAGDDGLAPEAPITETASVPPQVKEKLAGMTKEQRFAQWQAMKMKQSQAASVGR